MDYKKLGFGLGLFSVGLGPSRIASKVLHGSKPHLSTALLDLRSKMELNLSGLQQSNGLTVISFKVQLSDLDAEGILIRGLPVYL